MSIGSSPQLMPCAHSQSRPGGPPVEPVIDNTRGEQERWAYFWRDYMQRVELLRLSMGLGKTRPTNLSDSNFGRRTIESDGVNTKVSRSKLVIFLEDAQSR